MAIKKATTKKAPRTKKAPVAKKAGRGKKVATRKFSASGVRVRMYRQGLGDCFLITMPGKSGKPFYMLIDCGVVLGTQDPTTQMTNVVNDIVKVIKDDQIDLLVVTHEHWDHVSGFVQVQSLFDGLKKKKKIKKVWVAWTEDP